MMVQKYGITDRIKDHKRPLFTFCWTTFDHFPSRTGERDTFGSFRIGTSFSLTITVSSNVVLSFVGFGDSGGGTIGSSSDSIFGCSGGSTGFGSGFFAGLGSEFRNCDFQ